MPDTKIILITVFSLFVKGIFAKWVTQKAVSGFNWLVVRYLIKYPHEWITWEHYRKKRKGLGHNYPNPILCQDEDCKAF